MRAARARVHGGKGGVACAEKRRGGAEALPVLVYDRVADVACAALLRSVAQ